MPGLAYLGGALVYAVILALFFWEKGQPDNAAFVLMTLLPFGVGLAMGHVLQWLWRWFPYRLRIEKTKGVGNGESIR